MTAHEEENYLPRKPLDLPREPEDLPAGRQELAAHATETDSPFYVSQHDVRTLLSWRAPGRPFRRRGKEYYLSTLLITLLLQVILFLFSQYLLMLVVLSLVFVAFALVSVPPHDFQYKISTEGITIEDHYFLWQELYDFYFKRRESIDVLHIRTRALLPGELTLTLGDVHKDQVKSILLAYLPFREYIKPTFMEKSADWLAHNFPLEKITI